MTPRVIASRSSATFFPEKSRLRAADAADCPALRAPFSAFCWRARALPPALAARLRAAVLRDDDEPERLLDGERRPLDELELRELELRALDARELEPRELALRELPLDFRVPELDLLRDDPLPLPLFESAIAILLRSSWAHRGCAPHYFMPAVAVTYA